MNKKKLIFSGVVLIIIASIVISGCISFLFLFSAPPQEKSEPIVFRDILLNDSYNSSFRLDTVEFTTESPEFFSERKNSSRGLFKKT